MLFEVFDEWMTVGHSKRYLPQVSKPTQGFELAKDFRQNAVKQPAETKERPIHGPRAAEAIAPKRYLRKPRNLESCRNANLVKCPGCVRGYRYSAPSGSGQ